MYRLHFDLSNLFPDYPISPGESLARLIIPIYNIWGIWNTFATIAEHFKKETEATITRAGESLYFWLPLLYIAYTASTVAYIRLRWPFSGGDVTPVLFLVSTICDVFLSVAWLQMPRIIFSGINNLKSIKQRFPDHGKSEV